MDVIERWVEKGEAPKQIVGAHHDGAVDRKRPLCPYPEVATYTGAGSLDEAGSFVCKKP
jgi:feruloyl esterase